MNSEVILIYVLKSTVITAILYAYYRLALSDNKFHYYNRFYLLGSLILSLTIPFLDLHWFTFERPVTENTNLALIQLITAPSNQIIEQQFDWTDGLLIGAGIIAFIFLAMLVISIWKIFNIKRKSPIRYLDGIDFIETEVDNAPFSFLNNLFWKKVTWSEQLTFPWYLGGPVGAIVGGQLVMKAIWRRNLKALKKIVEN